MSFVLDSDKEGGNLIFVQFGSADWTGLVGSYGVAYAPIAKDMSTFCRHDVLSVAER